ncbi:MAG TPA: hypothetical protein ACFYD2_05665 [Candidatus Avalokitesvara rifleensis]|nr:hypothetical protein [Candidatus Brocadiales bacterium]
MDKDEYGLGCDASSAFCAFWLPIILVIALIVYFLEGIMRGL